MNLCKFCRLRKLKLHVKILNKNHNVWEDYNVFALRIGSLEKIFKYKAKILLIKKWYKDKIYIPYHKFSKTNFIKPIFSIKNLKDKINITHKLNTISQLYS